MRIGITALILSYILSQFYRAFLAVLAPILAVDLHTTPETLAAASGWWFLSFAMMQLPVGAALDRVGPRLTAAVLLSVAAVGAVVFASATTPGQINLAMALIGIGCSPILMASYFIFARSYSAAVFGTMAGIAVGIGGLGNLAASLPLSWAVAAFGWRGTLWALAGVTLAASLAVFVAVRDPDRVAGPSKGSVLSLLKMPALWPVMIMMAACYAPSAGLRGLWIGPWYAEVFGAGAARIGQVTLIMGLAMVAGNMAYGPMERLLGSRKGLVFGGNSLMLACLLGLYVRVGTDDWATVALLAGVGFFGASFAIVMTHGRAFLPAHLTGRGVSLINLFGIGAAGLMQMATGRIHAATQPDPATAPYAAILLAYAALAGFGLLIYLLSKDRTD